jgi:glycerophosphoryl diester phosphodiesterase
MITLVITAILFAEPNPNWQTDVRLIAHRGGVVDEERIENSHGAVEEAIRRGYWMLEVDIRRSRDGVPIAHHDRDFTRYYQDPRRVDQLTAEEITRLQSPAGHSPLTLDQYAQLCHNRIRLMLDIKIDADQEFLTAIESILAKYDLLATAWLLGPENAKRHFASTMKVSIGPAELAAAAERGEKGLAKRYFLFGVAAHITNHDIALARQLNVIAAPAVNTFRYQGADQASQAATDIQRLRALGVDHFQIDSVYESQLSTAKPIPRPQGLE